METVPVNFTMPDNSTLVQVNYTTDNSTLVQVNYTTDNSTLVYASTNGDPNEEIYLACEKYIFNICCALTVATLIYGVTSWCLLQKFRNYRNYVFLNAILLNFLVFVYNFSVVPMIRYVSLAILAYLFIYLAAAKIFWLIVICHMFYVDIVKVFDGHIRRKYLKSALFGWGASLLTSITTILIYTYTSSTAAMYTTLVIPLIFNSSLYIFILWSLFRSSNASANTKSKKGRLLFIATLIYLLSDGFILFALILQNVKPTILVKFIAFILNRLMTSIILNVYLVIVKKNRELWYEFYVKKMNERKRNRDMQMNVKNVRPKGPAVIKVEN